MSSADDLVASLMRSQQNRERHTANANKEAAKKKRDLSKYKVTKSNALARAFYSFTLSEKRVFEALVSQIHPLRTDNEQKLAVTAKEYSKAYGVELPNAYTQLSNAVDGLLNKIIVVELDERKETHKFNLTSRAIYKHQQGAIEVEFSKHMIPHIQGLRDRFTSYPLKQAANFRSVYTWRFYELLVSWAKPKKEVQGHFAGWFKADLFELRKQLGVPESYRFDNFQAKVLNVVTRELAEKAHIHLSIERIKTSRKITHLDIRFIEMKPENKGGTEKEQHELAV